ncbi:hypothetical protein A0J61_03462 [Choanephora cucurbitarum]|uniref:Uncharacterized protein n=1 Tax=Choanephora cucurbitarum TaxID=101091 RepID=A0A1C7NHN2_9FUNG|nr:hypothetical protein A0J61_03462 [Choanephora cucurbitarum]
MEIRLCRLYYQLRKHEKLFEVDVNQEYVKIKKEKLLLAKCRNSTYDRTSPQNKVIMYFGVELLNLEKEV